MEFDVDHYSILGLPSGIEGAKFTEKEISKAYKLKALELHPDKRPDDPTAHAKFQKLQSSYEILKDEETRKLFDDGLRFRHMNNGLPSYCDAAKRGYHRHWDNKSKTHNSKVPVPTKEHTHKVFVKREKKGFVPDFYGMDPEGYDGTDQKEDDAIDRDCEYFFNRNHPKAHKADWY